MRASEQRFGGEETQRGNSGKWRHGDLDRGEGPRWTELQKGTERWRYRDTHRETETVGDRQTKRNRHRGTEKWRDRDR